MIKHFIKTNRDEEEIIRSSSQLKINNPQPESYKNIVVPKPWGCEFLFFECDNIAAWFLSIEKGHSTSMHCHPNKKTILIVLSGKALGRTLNSSLIINAGEVVIYEQGVFHSTKAITKIELAEIESPVIKTDLLRLEDNYGREKMGYEDKKTMCKSSEYFYLNNNNKLISKSNYDIILSNIIKAKHINVVGTNNSQIIPNTCIFEKQDIVLEDAYVLNFKFPSRENLYEYRQYI